MNKLEGKVAVVTGGGSGIGKATVEKFVQEGAKVVIGDINSVVGSETEKEFKDQGYDILFVETDVTNEDSVIELFDKAEEAFGKIDISFNNAGIATQNLVHELTFEQWRKTMDVNLDGVFLTAKHAVKKLLKHGGGSIINTASIMGHVAAPEQSPYNSAKHAVVGLTKTMGLEYAEDNIRVNAICPGYIKTPLLDILSEEERQEIANMHAMKRLGKPEEIANAVLFLASDDSSFMTGSSLIVDGGYTAQ